MPTRMELYGLDRYYGNGIVKPGEAEERMRLLAVARADMGAEQHRNPPLFDLLAWLKEEAPERAAEES